MDNSGNDMSQICLTGAGGYLGKKIAANLKNRGINVISIVRSPSDEDDVVCDLLNQEMVNDIFRKNDIDIVIHCAAIVPKSIGDYNKCNMYESNVKMLENISNHKLSRLIYCSSVSVYGTQAAGMLDESMAIKDTTVYANSKAACENLLMKNGENNYAIARLPGLFGGGRADGLVFNTVNSLLKNNLPDLPNVIPAWSAMHVEDAAELIVEFLINDIPNKVLCNLGYGIPQSIQRLINECISLLNIDDLALVNVADNWVCQNINEQLRHVGPPPNSWHQRLSHEIEIIRESSVIK